MISTRWAARRSELANTVEDPPTERQVRGSVGGGRSSVRCRAATVGWVEPWEPRTPGALRLPSGRLVRGRGLRYRPPEGVFPEFGLYLQGGPAPPVDWSSRWVRWPDMWLPVDRNDARVALIELWRRAESERVEVACTGGQGRTGAALACLAILDGVPAAGAVRFVRKHYNPRAVETPWQRRYVRQFQP